MCGDRSSYPSNPGCSNMSAFSRSYSSLYTPQGSSAFADDVVVITHGSIKKIQSPQKCRSRLYLARQSPPFVVNMVAFKLAALVASVLPATASALASPPTYGGITPKPRDGHWVDTWGTMPQLTEPANLPPPPFVGLNHIVDRHVKTQD